MKKYPGMHIATSEWAEDLQRVSAGLPNGRWVPARCEPFYGGIFRRFSLAWAVFTGRADALFWEEQ